MPPPQPFLRADCFVAMTAPAHLDRKPPAFVRKTLTQVSHPHDHRAPRVEGQVLKAPTAVEVAHGLVERMGDDADAGDHVGGGERGYTRRAIDAVDPGMAAQPHIEGFSAAIELALPIVCGERTRRRRGFQDRVKLASSASAGIVAAGRAAQASKRSQSLAGMVTTTRLRTSVSAASSALRRMNSLRVVRDCAAAAWRMARSSGLTRTLRSVVVVEALTICMTMANSGATFNRLRGDRSTAVGFQRTTFGLQKVVS